MKIFRGVILPLMVIALLSCDAPQLNPLDPNNPDYKLALLDGFVKSATNPPQPITGAKVFWKNQNILSTTDVSGYFKIDALPMQNGMIYFDKNGFSGDSLFIEWNNQISKRVNVNLNSIPQLDSILIFTSVKNRYPADHADTLFIQTRITDAEGDVDSVFVKCKELNFYKQLNLNSTTKFYQNNFSQSDLNLQSFDDGIGKIFEIIVKDKDKKIFNIGSSSIKRIIRQEVLPKLPSNKETVGAQPALLWYRFLPGFNFRYLVQIYTDEIFPALVWEKDNVSKDDIQIVPTINLTPGDYFWVIWCIDEFQDRSRSKPASFVVQ